MIDQNDSSEERDLHPVSTKVVFYTPDYSHVLAMHMFRGTDHELYGLPGGHIDAGEVPDQTIIREIEEELGIVVSDLQHIDFITHTNGKIVLAYKGSLPYDTQFSPSDPEKETGLWMTRDEFTAIKTQPSYKKIVLDHWQ